MADGSLALGGAGGGSISTGDTGKSRSDWLNKAKQSMAPTIDFLNNAEQSASDKPKDDDDESLDEQEKNVVADKVDNFKNSVKGAAAGAAALKSGNYLKAASNFKKAGPIGGIIAGIIMFAMMSYMGNSLAPFSLVNVFQSKDPLNVTNQRVDNLMTRMMAPSSRKKTVTIDGKKYEINNISKARIFQPDKFKLTSYQKSKLKKNGFEIKTEKGITVLKRGNTTIVPDSKYADKFKGKGEVLDYKTALSGSDDLSLSLKQGTMTFRSRVRYWFDTKIKNLFSRIGLSRNRASDMKKGDIDELKQHTTQGDEDPDLGKARLSNETEFEQKTDADGNPIIKNGEPEYNTKPKTNTGNAEDFSGIKKGATPTEIESKISDVANAKKPGGVLSGAASKIAQVGCMASNIVGSVLNLMRALNLMQVRQVALQFFEIAQKAQAGDNIGDSLNTVASSLITPAKNTYKSGLFSSGKLEDSKKESMTDVVVEGSAMQANGIISKYEGKPRAPDTATGALNPMANLGELGPILQKFGLSLTSFKTCASLQIITSLTSILEEIKDVGTIVTCFSPAAAAGCTGLLLSVGKKIAAAITIQLVINALVSWLVPKVANWLVLDISTQLFGQQLGNVIGEGIMDIMNRNAQSGGSSLATKSTLLDYKNYEHISLAEEARYERATRSPFDPTSQYTFLGSLVTKLGAMSNSMSSPLSSLASIGSTAVSALGNILPHANAVEDAKYADYLQEYTKDYCPNLYSINALAGDAFCNPVMIEDVSTLDVDPAEVVLRLDNDDELKCFEQGGEDSDIPTINQEGKCMEYILWYTQRESEFGVADMNIANSKQIEGDNTTVSAVVNAIPVIGEVADIVNNTNALERLGYITGEVGVTKNDGQSLSSIKGEVPQWKKVKYIQRFISDQRILEGVGLIEESSVTAALRTYYENHPLDNSFEGILARKTGMTKENVEIALSFIKMASFIAEYEPAGYGPYIIRLEEQKDDINVGKEHVIQNLDYYKNTASVYYIIRREYSIA